MAEQRILVLAEGQLGDLLILTPALRALKEHFPRSTLTALIAQRRSYGIEPPPPGVFRQAVSGTADVLLRSPWVDEVVEVDRAYLRTLPLAARIRGEVSILAWLARGRFTHVVCTLPQERFLLWAAASRARVRVGQRNQARAFLLTHRPDLDRRKGGVLRYYCDLAKAIGAPVRSMETEYRVSEHARAWAVTMLRELGFSKDGRLAVVHPGASGPYRVWPPERYAALIARISEMVDGGVLLCGSSFDQDVLDEISRHLRMPLPQLNPGASVDRLGAILERAALVVSNDSGPRHLAVALGTPSVAFMPRFQDSEWKIYDDQRRSVVLQGKKPCPLCREGMCQDRLPTGERFGSACIRMIDVEAASAAVSAMLAVAAP